MCGYLDRTQCGICEKGKGCSCAPQCKGKYCGEIDAYCGKTCKAKTSDCIPCSSAWCKGCCNGTDDCQQGNTDAACGKDGVTCRECKPEDDDEEDQTSCETYFEFKCKPKEPCQDLKLGGEYEWRTRTSGKRSQMLRVEFKDISIEEGNRQAALWITVNKNNKDSDSNLEIVRQGQKLRVCMDGALLDADKEHCKNDSDGKKGYFIIFIKGVFYGIDPTVFICVTPPY